MFANRLQLSDNRKGSSTSLWLTGIVVGGSVVSLYYFHRLRRSALLSQRAAEQSSASESHDLQFLVVLHGVSGSELQDLVDASSELGVKGVWVVHGGHLQTETVTQLTGESAHIHVFKTANECCKALQTEQWEVYIGSTAEQSTSHQSSEDLLLPDSKSAVVISATDVPECFLQAAKKTLHAGSDLSSPDLLRHALQQLAGTPAQDREVEAARSGNSTKSTAAPDLPLSTSVHFDSDAETDSEGTAVSEQPGDAADDSHTEAETRNAPSIISMHLASSATASPPQTVSEASAAQQDSGSEQSQTSLPVSETAQRQDLPQLRASSPLVQPSPDAQPSPHAQPGLDAQPSPHSQPSPMPTSPSGSHSSGSVSSHSPSQHSGSQGSLTDKQNDSNPMAHPPAQSGSAASTHTQSSASTHTQSSASTHAQSSASTHTQSPASAGRQSSVSDSPERPSEQCRTEQSVQSQQHSVQDTASDPEQPPPAAQELAHKDGPSQYVLPASAPTPQSSSETLLDTHSKKVAEKGKAAAVPRKPWQSSDTDTTASASQPAAAPFWQRQSRDADSASSQPTAVPFWLRKDAASARASDDTASVSSEPAGRPFWQRDSTPAAKAASDSGSVKSESTAMWKGSADTASVASDGAVVPFWQRANSSTVRSGASDTSSVHSGPAPVPVSQRQGITDTATSQPAAVPFWQKADSSSATATSQPSTAPFWQNRGASSDTAASASARNLPSWQNMQTGPAVPLTSQASSSSIASSSRGSGLGGHAMASTAQRALFEGQGSDPASSRAPLQSYSGNTNPVAASSSPAGNSQVSDIARLQAQAMRRSGVLRRHVGDSRTGSSLGSPTGSVASAATSGWPDTPSSNR